MGSSAFRKACRICALGLLVVAGTAGCAATHTALSYHDQNAEERTFWMTVVTRSPDATDTASLWRCMNYADGPACVQAKLVTCAKPPCEFKADVVDDVTALEGGNGAAKSLLPMPK